MSSKGRGAFMKQARTRWSRHAYSRISVGEELGSWQFLPDQTPRGSGTSTLTTRRLRPKVRTHLHTGDWLGSTSLRRGDGRDAEMEKNMLRAIVAVIVVCASVSSAYAAAKTQHISTMKAQCSADVKSKGLTGQAAKAEYKKCWAGGGEVAH